MMHVARALKTLATEFSIAILVGTDYVHIEMGIDAFAIRIL